MKFKKTLSLLLVVAMMVTLAVPAFAISQTPRYIMIEDNNGMVMAFDVVELADNPDSPLWDVYAEWLGKADNVYIGYQGGAADGVIVGIDMLDTENDTIEQLTSKNPVTDDVADEIAADPARTLYYAEGVTDEGLVVKETPNGEPVGIIDETGTFVPDEDPGTDPGTDPGDDEDPELVQLLEDADAIIAALEGYTSITGANRAAAHATVADAETIIDDLGEYEDTEDVIEAVQTEIDRVKALEGYEEPDSITVVSATVDALGNYTIVFSGDLDETTAETTTVYSLSGGGLTTGAPTTAELQEDGRTVVLAKTGAKKGATVTIAITGLRDADSNVQTIDPVDVIVPASNNTKLTSLKYSFAATFDAAIAGTATTDLTALVNTADNTTTSITAESPNTAVKILAVPVNEVDSNVATANATISWRVGNTGAWTTYDYRDGIVVALENNNTININIRITAQDGTTVTTHTVRATMGTINSVILLNSESAGTAGNAQITGLTSGRKYVVDEYAVNGTVTSKGVKSDGTLGANAQAAQALTGNKIIGLTNGTTYFVREMSSDATIKSFAVMVSSEPYYGEIVHPVGGANGTIVVTAPAGEDYTSVNPIVTPNGYGATVDPPSLDTVNLNPGITVVYTVTAEDGTTAKYNVSLVKDDIIAIPAVDITIKAPVQGTNTSGVNATITSSTPGENMATATATAWYSNQQLFTGPFVIDRVYEAYITLTAKPDYKFTTGTEVTLPAGASIIGEKKISADAEGNRLTFSVLFPGATAKPFVPYAGPYTVASALDTQYHIWITNETNKEFTVNPDTSGGSNNVTFRAQAGDPAINRAVYALLEGLIAGDTVTFDTDGLMEAIDVGAGATTTEKTIPLVSTQTASTITITGKDAKTLNITGSANSVVLEGESSTTSKFDVSGLEATAISTSDTASIVVLGPNQKLTAGIDTEVEATPIGKTTGEILVDKNIEVKINGIVFTPTGASGTATLRIESNRINVVSSNAATSLTIDASGAEAATINLNSVNTEVEFTGHATNPFTLTGSMATGKDVKILAGAGGVNLAGVTFAGGGKINIDGDISAKVAAGTNPVTINKTNDSNTLTIAGAGVVTGTNLGGDKTKLVVDGNITSMTTATADFAGYTHNSGTIGTLSFGASNAAEVGAAGTLGTGSIGTLNVTGTATTSLTISVPVTTLNLGADAVALTIAKDVTTVNVNANQTGITVDGTDADVTVGRIDVNGDAEVGTLTVANTTSGTATVTTLNARDDNADGTGDGKITKLVIGGGNGNGVVASGYIKASGADAIDVQAKGVLGTAGQLADTTIEPGDNSKNIKIASGSQIHAKILATTVTKTKVNGLIVSDIIGGEYFTATGTTTGATMFTNTGTTVAINDYA